MVIYTINIWYLYYFYIIVCDFLIINAVDGNNKLCNHLKLRSLGEAKLLYFYVDCVTLLCLYGLN